MKDLAPPLRAITGCYMACLSALKRYEAMADHDSKLHLRRPLPARAWAALAIRLDAIAGTYHVSRLPGLRQKVLDRVSDCWQRCARAERAEESARPIIEQRAVQATWERPRRAAPAPDVDRIQAEAMERELGGKS